MCMCGWLECVTYRYPGHFARLGSVLRHRILEFAVRVRCKCPTPMSHCLALSLTSTKSITVPESGACGDAGSAFQD